MIGVNGFIEKLPSIKIFAPKTESKISDSLKKAAIRIEPRKYLLAASMCSLVASAYATILLFLLFLHDIAMAAASFLVFFGLLLLFFMRLPKILAKKRAEKIESELPSVLREMSLFIDLGMPFEQALGKIAEGGYLVSGEFRKALNEIAAGSSVLSAMNGISSRVDSRHVVRAVNQVSASYEYGTGGENLQRLANDLVDLQKAKNREFSSRLSFLGLLFISASALIPAFFQVLLVVFSSLPQFDFPQYYIWAAFLLLFPSIDLLVLLLAWALMPSANSAKKFDLRKALAKMKIDFGTAAGFSALLFFLGILSAIAGIFIGILLYVAAVLLVIPVAAYYLLEYIERKRIREIENSIPDALFHAASLQNIARQEKIIEAIADAGYGALSEEFMAANNQVKSGMGVGSALSDMGERTGSKLLERINFLMLHGYKSGGEIRRALRETAENAFSFLSLERERASSLAMQKYTIVFGGAMLVPLILGSVLAMATSLDIGDSGLFGGEKKLGISEIKGSLVLANQIYIGIYCLLASFMVGYMDGDRSRFLPYFVFMLLVSVALFSFASGANFLKAGF